MTKYFIMWGFLFLGLSSCLNKPQKQNDPGVKALEPAFFTKIKSKSLEPPNDLRYDILKQGCSKLIKNGKINKVGDEFINKYILPSLNFNKEYEELYFHSYIQELGYNGVFLKTADLNHSYDTLYLINFDISGAIKYKLELSRYVSYPGGDEIIYSSMTSPNTFTRTSIFSFVDRYDDVKEKTIVAVDSISEVLLIKNNKVIIISRDSVRYNR